MLRNSIKELAQEARRALSNLDRILEALRLDLSEGNNTIALVDLGLITNSNLGQRNRLGDEVDGLARGTNGLQVTKGLADPVQRAAVLGESFDGLGAAGDEDGVDHGGAETLEVVVGLDG